MRTRFAPFCTLVRTPCESGSHPPRTPFAPANPVRPPKADQIFERTTRSSAGKFQQVVAAELVEEFLHSSPRVPGEVCQAFLAGIAAATIVIGVPAKSQQHEFFRRVEVKREDAVHQLDAHAGLPSSPSGAHLCRAGFSIRLVMVNTNLRPRRFSPRSPARACRFLARLHLLD